MNMGGTPAILVNIITAKCSYLVRMTIRNHSNNSELGADGYGVIKERHDLLRARGSHNIVIAGNIAKNKVTHATADKICFITRLFQPEDNLFSILTIAFSHFI